MSFYRDRTILPMLLAVALLAGSLSLRLEERARAQMPTQPGLTVEQRSELIGAERLNEQVAQLYQQGKFNAAIPLAEQALAIRKHILGENHPDVATSLNNLAKLYHDQGRYTEAEPLYQRSLQIREAQLGKDHPHVATSLNNLAALYRAQGRYPEAEPL